MTNTDDATHQDYDALVAGALVASALLLEHVALWPWLKHVPVDHELAPLFPYTIGTATIGMGLTALASQRPLRWVDFWIVAGFGGALVASARLWRWWLAQDRAMQRQRGRSAGQVAGGKTTLDEVFRRS